MIDLFPAADTFILSNAKDVLESIRVADMYSARTKSLTPEFRKFLEVCMMHDELNDSILPALQSFLAPELAFVIIDAFQNTNSLYTEEQLQFLVKQVLTVASEAPLESIYNLFVQLFPEELSSDEACEILQQKLVVLEHSSSNPWVSSEEFRFQKIIGDILPDAQILDLFLKVYQLEYPSQSRAEFILHFAESRAQFEMSPTAQQILMDESMHGLTLPQTRSLLYAVRTAKKLPDAIIMQTLGIAAERNMSPEVCEALFSQSVHGFSQILNNFPFGSYVDYSEFFQRNIKTNFKLLPMLKLNQFDMVSSRDVEDYLTSYLHSKQDIHLIEAMSLSYTHHETIKQYCATNCIALHELNLALADVFNVTETLRVTCGLTETGLRSLILKISTLLDDPENTTAFAQHSRIGHFITASSGRISLQFGMVEALADLLTSFKAIQYCCADDTASLCQQLQELSELDILPEDRITLMNTTGYMKLIEHKLPITLDIAEKLLSEAPSRKKQDRAVRI